MTSCLVLTGWNNVVAGWKHVVNCLELSCTLMLFYDIFMMFVWCYIHENVLISVNIAQITTSTLKIDFWGMLALH